LHAGWVGLWNQTHYTCSVECSASCQHWLNYVYIHSPVYRNCITVCILRQQ
jgi:hypothetical protein